MNGTRSAILLFALGQVLSPGSTEDGPADWTGLPLNGLSEKISIQAGSSILLKVSLLNGLPENFSFYVSTVLRHSDKREAFLRLRFLYQARTYGVKNYSKVRWNCGGLDCENLDYLKEDYTKVEGVYTMTYNKVWAEGVDPISTPAECEECWRSAVLSADSLQFYVKQPDIEEVDLPPLEQMIKLSFRTIDTVMFNGWLMVLS